MVPCVTVLNTRAKTVWEIVRNFQSSSIFASSPDQSLTDLNRPAHFVKI